MAHIQSFHSATGASDFLGLRPGRRGGTEIVYDDGVARRIVWRATDQRTGGDADAARLSDALERAVNQPRVLPALYSELKRRAIAVEIIAQ
jgi:hypothetical protein